MTLEEIHAINRKLAEWVGIDSHTCDEWAFHCDDCERGSIQTPDDFRSNSAMDLLGVLVERGYKPELSYHNLNWWCKFSLPGYKQPEYYAMKPTIPEAICKSILKLIEREGKE